MSQLLLLPELCKKGDVNAFNNYLSKTKNEVDINLTLRKIVELQINKFKQYFTLLIQKGADINFVDKRQRKTNLMIACQGTSQIIFEILLSCENINIEAQDQHSKNALFYALLNKNKDCSLYYLEKLLMKSYKLINSNANHTTLLILAIQKQKIQVIKLLLENNINVNFQISDSGNTALFEAVRIYKCKKTQKKTNIIKLLLQFGADYNICNKKGQNIFLFAHDCVQQLKEIINCVQKQKEKKQKIEQIDLQSQKRQLQQQQNNDNDIDQDNDDGNNESIVFQSLEQQINNFKNTQLQKYQLYLNQFNEYFNFEIQSCYGLCSLFPLFVTMLDKFELVETNQGGISTYTAIVIMYNFIRSHYLLKVSSYTKILMDFLYYFGFCATEFYYYAYSDHLKDQLTLRIQIIDPFKQNIDIGSKIDAFRFQNMLKTAYICLSMDITYNKLRYTFQMIQLVTSYQKQ